MAPPKFESGIFQKLKDWKSDKASAALSHFNKFKEHKHLMTASFLPTAVKAPVDAANFDIPKPIDSTFIPHLPESIHPPTANPPQVHFPLTPSYFEPLKYENFPPNFVQSPLLFNSYGVPIPQDTYAPPHFVSHDRVSSASEEKSSVLPAPSILDDKLKHQDIKEEIAQSNVLQQPSQIAPKFLTENFQKVQLQPAQTEVHPVYKPKPSTSGEEGRQLIIN